MEIIKKIFLVIWEIIKWIFVTSWRLNMILFALVDLWLGDGSWWRSLTERSSSNNNQDKAREIEAQIPRTTTDKIVNNYGKELENYVESKSTTSIEALILEKIKNSRGKLIKDVLSEEEMNIFIMMILRAYDLISLD
jgi:hypothetical protein